jgi:protein-disulfide isomerase
VTKSVNTVEQEPATSRRQVVTLAAALATAVVVGTWFYSSGSRRVTAADGPLTRPSKRPKLAADQLAKELAKPGPQPEIVVGKADAPITIVEYADLTCPACAAFHKTVLPQLKEKYIDTGKAKIVFREFPTNTPSMIAFMAVRCTTVDKAWGLISALFAKQDEWRGATSFDDLRNKLFSFGQQVGMTRQTFDSCIPAPKDNKLDLTPQQEQLAKDIATVRDRAHDSFGVASTPTFFINGKRLPHATIEEFDKALTSSTTP